MPPTYGLDIETDTTVDGLDPTVSPVVSIALIGDEVELVLDGDEAVIIAELDRTLATLPAGVLITWNGGGFDLPFLRYRAARLGLGLGLELCLDPLIGGRHDPLPGHAGAYRGRWHHHGHVDGYQLFRADVGATLGFSCGLKSLARMVGLPVVEVDRARIHDLSEAERRAYVASDARLARTLVERRTGWIAAVDQLSSGS
jgi:hypothetical protein